MFVVKFRKLKMFLECYCLLREKLKKVKESLIVKYCSNLVCGFEVCLRILCFILLVGI